MARRLTGEETRAFNFIHDSDSNVALMQTTFDGEETAVIAAVNEDEDGSYEVIPLAVLLTPGMFEKLENPADSLT